MRLLFKGGIICFSLLYCLSLFANTDLSPWVTQNPTTGNTLRVDLFMSSTCPHCQKADAFFKGLEKTVPWISVNRFVINQDQTALKRFSEILHQMDMQGFAVPAIFFCNSRWIGFLDDETTGESLLKGLKYCYQQIQKNGTLSPTTVQVLRQWGATNQYNTNLQNPPSNLLYIVLMGFSDAIGMCSLFCVGILLAFLGLFASQTRKQWKILAVFLFGFEITHFLQQHDLPLYDGILGWASVGGRIIGLGLISYLWYFAREKPSLTIQRWTLVLLLVTTIAVYLLQETCPFNFSLMFEQWLNERHVSTTLKVLYQLLYQLCFLLPITLLGIFYTVLCYSRVHKRVWNTAQWIAGRIMLLIVGLTLLIAPNTMNHAVFSLFALLVSFLVGGFVAKRIRREGNAS